MLGIALELRPKDDATMQRLQQRKMQPEQLQAATPAAQHTHFLAALLQPRLEAAEAAIKDAIQVVSRMQQQVKRLAQPVEVMEQLSAKQQATIAQQARQRVNVNLLELRFNENSKFATEFGKRFGGFLGGDKEQEGWLPGAAQALLDSEEVWDPLVSGVVESVVEKLAAEYNLFTPPAAVASQLSSSKPKPAKVRQLLHELAPAYMWLHPKAPLSRWMSRATRTALEPLLEGLQDLLLEQLQPQVVDIIQKLLQEALVEWAQTLLGLDTPSLQLLVTTVLQRMKLGDWVKGSFRKAFFLNYTRAHTFMTPYRK
jgi:restriction endonuclease Mrr